jgi:phosphoribosylformylglycinamidine synthase
MGGSCSASERLFAEELGAVIECHRKDAGKVVEILHSFNLPSTLIGETTEDKRILVTYHSKKVLESDVCVLRSWWEETSYQIERLQMNSQCADEERKNIFDRKRRKLSYSFQTQPTPARLLEVKDKPEVPFSGKRGAMAIAR